MERQLDLSQSGQVFLDGRGPFTPEDSENLSPNPTSTREPCDASQVEVVMDDGTIRIEVGKESIHPDIVGNRTKTLKRIPTIEGTHSHLKNNLHHVCTNTPFPFFYESSYLYVDRTDFMKNRIKDLLDDPDYPPLDQILRIFLDEKLEILLPLKVKFSHQTAKKLFLFGDISSFYYGCLTPFDCDLLRIAILSKFQIRKCPCSGPNCFDMSNIAPQPTQSSSTTARLSGNCLQRKTKRLKTSSLTNLQKLKSSEDEGNSSE
jgi:hypothetical protein